MMDNEDVRNDDSDEDISDKHTNLLEFIEKLDRSQRIKQPTRTEPTLQVSEYHLVNSGITAHDAVCVDELVKTLDDKTHFTNINKKIHAAKKTVSILQKPLEKSCADRLKRAVGFDNTAKELEKWNAIITKNRIIPTQVFPSSRPSSLTEPEEFVNRFKIQSEMERELIALDFEAPNENEGEKNEFTLTLEEIVQKRLETAKLRTQQSYKQAKAQRLKKIKSKKFHRIAKKARIKELLNEFMRLQRVNPQAALAKLELLDRARAEERMSLKHKNTSHWAKNKQIRAKYDKESRSALAKQLSIGRELMEKVKKGLDSNDEITNSGPEVNEHVACAKSNPWMNIDKTAAEIGEFVTGYRKYWQKKHDLLKGMSTELHEQHTDNGGKNMNDDNDHEDGYNIVSHDSNMEPSKEQQFETSNMNLKTISGNVNGVVTKAGTSEWSIENFENDMPSMMNVSDKSFAIDNMFATIENNVKQRIRKKLHRVKRKLRAHPAETYESVNNLIQSVGDTSFRSIKLRPQLDQNLDEIPIGNCDRENFAVSTVNGRGLYDITSNRNLSDSIDFKAGINPDEFINVNSRYCDNQFDRDNNDKYHKNKTNEYDRNKQAQIMKGCNDLGDENGEIDSNINQQNFILEAFADDNIVDEFRKEKADDIDGSRFETMKMHLPGWGVWGGTNIKHPKKKRRFILTQPLDSAKNDENNGNIIIIQDNSILRKHQVNDLPHPFTSVTDFESSIRAPIGRNFIPENAHKRLIQPIMKTRMGRIISPMKEDVLVDRKKINIREDLRHFNDNLKI